MNSIQKDFYPYFEGVKKDHFGIVPVDSILRIYTDASGKGRGPGEYLIGYIAIYDNVIFKKHVVKWKGANINLAEEAAISLARKEFPTELIYSDAKWIVCKLKKLGQRVQWIPRERNKAHQALVDYRWYNAEDGTRRNRSACRRN